MAAGRVRWLPGADPGADAEEARRRRRRSRSPLTRTAAKDPHQEQRGPPMWKQKACTARMTLLLAAYDFYTKADTASLQPMTSCSLAAT